MRLNQLKINYEFNEPQKRKIKTRRVRRKITLGKERRKSGCTG